MVVTRDLNGKTLLEIFLRIFSASVELFIFLLNSLLFKEIVMRLILTNSHILVAITLFIALKSSDISNLRINGIGDELNER